MTGNAQPLRAGNLGRVSKDDSGRARSVDEQHDDNAAEAASIGAVITEKYQDSASASRFAAKAREDWPRLLADIEAGRLDVVLLWEPSRGSRELEDWARFLRLCRDSGTRVHVTTHHRTYDMTIARDWRVLAEDGVDSQYESEKISSRVRRGLDANAADGMPHSQAPFGYRRVYDERGRLDRTQAQRPVESEAAVVRRVIAEVAAGISLSQIERDTGVLRSTIRKICLNPAYIGKRRTKAGLVDARWPAISDADDWEETWYLARAALEGKPRAGVNSRPGGAKYLLTGIMTCAQCSRPIEPDPPSARRRAAYSCRTGHASAAMAGIDEAVKALMAARCAEDDLYALLTAASGTEAETARAEAVRLQAELDEWLSAGISPRAYKAKEDEYLPLIAAARHRAEALAVPAPVRGIVGGDAAEVAAKLEAMTVAQRRAGARFLFERIELHSTPKRGPKGVPARERITWEWRTFG
jgi:DNA invertase Pin-like site-specific DNA recombinase